MFTGVSKSGSPISRWTMWRPWASSARPLAAASKAVSVPIPIMRCASFMPRMLAKRESCSEGPNGPSQSFRMRESGEMARYFGIDEANERLADVAPLLEQLKTDRDRVAELQPEIERYQ